MHIKKAYKDVQSALKKLLGKKYDWYGNGFFRPGPAPKFRDIEVIALCLTAEYLGIDSEADLFKQLQPIQKKYFPNLICRRQYNDRRKKLQDKIKELKIQLSDVLLKSENVNTYVVDSTPIPICRKSRHSRNTIGKNEGELQPHFSRCAAQDEWYFGYKFHVICSPEGVIKDSQITSANFDDKEFLWQEEVSEKYRNCTIVGDKGYINDMFKLYLLWKHDLCLRYPFKSNQKGKPALDEDLFLKRKRVETVFSQLKDQFNLARNLTKTFKGFATRIISKICSYTVIQYINKFINNKPIGNIKNALINEY